MSQKDGDQRATKEAWRIMGPWGWPTINQMVRPVEDVAALFPAKLFLSKPQNITSVVGELCRLLLNSETVKHSQENGKGTKTKCFPCI